MSLERILRRTAASLVICLLAILAGILPQSLAAQTPSNGVAMVAPTSLAFGGQARGTTSATQSFTLTNTGTGPLGSIAITVSNTDYAITSNTCAASLAVDASCTVTLSFTPGFEAPDPGSVVITDDAAIATTTVLLSGTGVPPTSIYVLPFEIFFDGQTPGTVSPAQTATLFNSTGAAAALSGTTIAGHTASDFSVVDNTCGSSLSGASCTLGITFTPSTTVLGPRTADLTIASSTTGTSTVSHLTGNGAIRHLPGFTANVLPPNDDGFTPNAIPLPFTVNFFGTSFTSLYVNNNGNVTFGQGLSEYTPTGLNSNNGGIPIIAPYWADVDTRAATDGTPPSAVVTFGVDTVNGHQAFGVDYENVGYYSAESDKLNSFQLILIDRSDTGIAGAFDMEFDYDKIQWEAGEASGGVDGLCGTLPVSECVPAAVGYTNGTGDAGTNFQLPGSFVAGAFLDGGPPATSLIQTALNSGVPGRIIFQVRNGTVQSADLSLAMTQSASTVPAGGNETYTLTIANAGPNDATDTVVTDTLPTNATLVSATPSQGAACSGTVTLTCDLGTVANAASATVTVVVKVNAGATGTLVNSASVSSDLPDPNPANNSATITATIGASNTFALTVNVAGTGSGTVTSSPAGIDCPSTCSANFAGGTQVTLTDAAAEGSSFGGWSGACTGLASCVVTMTAAKSVTATFDLGTSVIIRIPPGGSTTATATPGGTANYGLLISGAPGVTGVVSLGCTASTPTITCSVIPSTVTLNGGITEVAFSIQTYCQAAAPFVIFDPGATGTTWKLLLFSMLLCGMILIVQRDRRVALTFAMLTLMTVALGTAACGSLAKNPKGATVPGRYTITLTTTFHGQTQTLPNFLTLVVK